jgi:hypothetical protein
MKRKIPRFKSEKEEALFWSKNSPLDYPEEVKEAGGPLQFAAYLLEYAAKHHKEKKRLVPLSMASSQILLAKIIAKKQGGNYQRLLKKWIREAILKELKENPAIEKEVKLP